MRPGSSRRARTRPDSGRCGWGTSVKHWFTIHGVDTSDDSWFGAEYGGGAFATTIVPLGSVGGDSGAADSAASSSIGSNVTSVDLYAFGRKDAPRAPRLSDFGVSSESDTAGPFAPTAVTDTTPGASVFSDPLHPDVKLSEHYHVLPAGTVLPPGMEYFADGADVGGTEPTGHFTV